MHLSSLHQSIGIHVRPIICIRYCNTLYKHFIENILLTPFKEQSKSVNSEKYRTRSLDFPKIAKATGGNIAYKYKKKVYEHLLKLDIQKSQLHK